MEVFYFSIALFAYVAANKYQNRKKYIFKLKNKSIVALLFKIYSIIVWGGIIYSIFISYSTFLDILDFTDILVLIAGIISLIEMIYFKFKKKSN